MRLVYTIPDFWPHVRRGSERIVHDLAAEMTRRGHQVTVITRDPHGRPTDSRDFGFLTRYRPGHQRLERLLHLDPLEAFAVTAAEAVLQEDADVYHAFYLTDAYGLSLGTRLRRRPFVFSWHGVPSASWWETNAPRTHHWYRRMLRHAARVTVMAGSSVGPMLADYGVEPLLLSPGVDTAAYAGPRNPADPPTMVYSAAIDDPRKRHELALDAFALLVGRGVDVQLLIVGPGDTSRVEAHLQMLAPGVRARVSMMPVVADLAPVYSRCSVGLLTSHEEAFGLVVAEYLASGMPAVVSDDGGAVEIVSATTATIYAAGDADACADAMQAALALAADPSTEAACRQRATLYDWQVRGDHYEALYREVVG